MDTFIRDRVLLHLRSIGFDESQTKSFLRRLGSWIRCSGIEWTAKRLKSLKEYHLKVLEGVVNPPIPLGWAVYQTRHRKVFKDPMVRMVMDLPNTGVSLWKKEAFLRIPTVLRLSELSNDQWTKFMESVTGPYTGTPEALSTALDAIDKGLPLLLGRINPADVQSSPFVPLRQWAPNDKRAPVLHAWQLAKGKTCKVSAKSRKNVNTVDFVTYFSYDKAGQGLWRTHPFHVSHVMVGQGEVIPIRGASWQLNQDIPAGRIGFIQEGGCKLRSIANPFLSLQALGEPLKRKLESITRCIPQIGTFDQSSSHDTIIEWILAGKEVASYDLSSFTDRFPYQLQQRVLAFLKDNDFINQFDVDACNLVVNKEWQLPGSKNQRVKWAVGQPLGFGPSFHLATLTHAALLRGLSKSKTFQVVGDDVAIGDPLLSKLYADKITDLGVSISTSKSLISHDYAEFCGKTLSKSGVNPSIKVKLIRSADQLVDTLSFYGPKGINFLSSNERKWLLKVILPEDLGGLGWSLPGSTYQERLNFLDGEAIAQHRLRTDLEKFLGCNSFSWEDYMNYVVEFDKVNRLKLEYIPTRSSYYPSSDDYVENKSTGGMLGVSSIGLSNISATELFTHGRVESQSTKSIVNTFTHLVDHAASSYLHNNRSMPVELRGFTAYLNRHGYINPKEKDVEVPIFNIWSTPDGNEIHQQYTRYLSRDERPSQPKVGKAKSPKAEKHHRQWGKGPRGEHSS